MKFKYALGLGLACTACCAILLFIGAGSLGLLGLISRNMAGIAVASVLLMATITAFLVQRLRSNAASCAVDGSCGCKPEGTN